MVEVKSEFGGQESGVVASKDACGDAVGDKGLNAGGWHGDAGGWWRCWVEVLHMLL